MQKIKLSWGDDFIEFDIPPSWNILGECYPKFLEPVSDVEEEINFTLKNPINSPPLKEICRGKNKITIVVDDISRPTPASLILPAVVREIENEVSLENVKIVMALGLHREMKEDEIINKVGREIYKKVKCINHNCKDKNNMVYLGRTKRGTPVYINKVVCEADLIVLIGTIEPHIHAGFGGGYKNILPGVAGVETIACNHLLSATSHNFSMVGWEPEKSPMRLDIEEAGEMLKKDIFLINTVLNYNLRIVRIFTGDPIFAHREGIKTAREIYGVKIPHQADIVITNSHPFDIDIRQSVKCIANTLFAAKPKGIIIALLKNKEGLGNFKPPKLKFLLSPVFIKIFAKLFLFVVRNFNIGIPSEMRFFLYSALKTISRNKILIYAPDLPQALTKSLPIFANFESFEKLIEHISKSSLQKKDVLVFPYGGITYPMI